MLAVYAPTSCTLTVEMLDSDGQAVALGAVTVDTTARGMMAAWDIGGAPSWSDDFAAMRIIDFSNTIYYNWAGTQDIGTDNGVARDSEGTLLAPSATMGTALLTSDIGRIFPGEVG